MVEMKEEEYRQHCEECVRTWRLPSIISFLQGVPLAKTESVLNVTNDATFSTTWEYAAVRKLPRCVPLLFACYTGEAAE